MGAALSRLLGRSPSLKKNTVNDFDKAVLDLKNARDRLKKYQRKLDMDTVTLVKQAQALVLEGRRDRALMLLKIKKYKLQQSDKADAQLFTVTQLIDTVEWEGHQSQVLAALAEGTKALNALHAEMPIEDVEQLMSDTQEALDYEAEISRIIGGNWTPEAEDALMEDFAALEKELAEESQEAKEQTKAEAAAAVTEIQTAAQAAEPEPELKLTNTESIEAIAADASAAESAATNAEPEAVDADQCAADNDNDNLLSQLPDVPTGAVVLPSGKQQQRQEEDADEEHRVAVPS